MTEEKKNKKLKSLIEFHSANKIDNFIRGEGEEKKKSKEFNKQVKT